MAVVNPYRSVITLNVNIEFTNQKSQNRWIDLKKQDPTICHLQETRFSSKTQIDFQANGNQKKAGIAIYISDKIDWKAKRVMR